MPKKKPKDLDDIYDVMVEIRDHMKLFLKVTYAIENMHKVPRLDDDVADDDVADDDVTTNNPVIAGNAIECGASSPATKKRSRNDNDHQEQPVNNKEAKKPRGRPKKNPVST